MYFQFNIKTCWPNQSPIYNQAFLFQENEQLVTLAII